MSDRHKHPTWEPINLEIFAPTEDKDQRHSYPLPISDTHKTLQRHHVRSFVRREGRITKGQKYALESLWKYYGIDSETRRVLDFDVLFARKAPVWLEIGFGNGEALATMASNLPEVNFLGVDVYRPGVGHLLRLVAANELNNIRVLCEDAVPLLMHQIHPQSLDRVLLFFPDPWPKQRHHKRRLVQPSFTSLLYTALRPEGLFHMATDWQDYALHALDVMTHEEGFVNTAEENGFARRPEYRPLTKFELRGRSLGHEVWDLLFRRR